MTVRAYHELKTPEPVKEISGCRVCGGKLIPVISLGKQHVVDFVESPGVITKPVAPLDVVLCDTCYLVQLRHTVAPELLFQTFWYRSSVNEQMRQALADVVAKGAEKVQLGDRDAVLSIGCNDGLELQLVKEIAPSAWRVGIDPSNQITTPEARARMHYGIRDFANMKSLQVAMDFVGQPFKLVLALAMFYDLEDPFAFLRTVGNVLADDGVLVIQMNYLVGMLQQNAFDNISHEHLCYYSLTSLSRLAGYAGFEIRDVELNNVNGGSFRVYLQKMSFNEQRVSEKEKARVENILTAEAKLGLTNPSTYLNFGLRVNAIGAALQRTVARMGSEGKVMYAYGASTRGTTLLQTIPLPLAGAAERDPNKYGRYMVGCWLPIFAEEFVRERADVFFVLPWHFKESILEREKEWAQKGGKFIFPLPRPEIVQWNAEKGEYESEVVRFSSAEVSR